MHAYLARNVEKKDTKKKRELILTKTCRVRLVVDKETENKLFELGDVFARCWNEINYLSRRQFFNEVRVDFATTEKMIYEKYKNVRGRILRRGNLFSNFLSLRRKTWPCFIIPRPPGYKKDRKKNKREPFLIIRHESERF